MSLTTLNTPRHFQAENGAEAFILIATSLGKKDEVLQELKKLNGVKEAHKIIGSYDILARLKTENYQALNDNLKRKIRDIRGVRSTIILIVT